LALAGRQSEADEWLLEGFRNVGDPDLLITVYERQIRGTDPVTLLEAWDESLKDLSDDGWYLLTTAWIAQRHGLTEEAIERFRRIPPDSPAWAHSQILRGAFDARRGHAQDAAAALSTATWAWIRLPFVWRCAGCGEISRQANYLCSTCGGWESFRMIRPYGSEEALAAKLVG
jgi:lipopolysaccharide biosynthesis regulator YciM